MTETIPRFLDLIPHDQTPHVGAHGRSKMIQALIIPRSGHRLTIELVARQNRPRVQAFRTANDRAAIFIPIEEWLGVLETVLAKQPRRI